MTDFLSRFLLYALSAILFSACSLGVLALFEKKLKSTACLLLVTLLLVRIFLPMGVFEHTLLTLGDSPVTESPTQEPTKPDEGNAVIPSVPTVLPDKTPTETPSLPALPSREPLITREGLSRAVCITVFGISALSLLLYLSFDAVTRRRIRIGATRVTEGEILTLYTRLADERGLDALPALYTSPGVTSPCLVGLWRPRIYLAEESSYDAYELSLLLAHELEHYRKGDLFKKFFALSIISFQWWNPFLRPLVRKLDLYLEEACDERVLAKGSEENTLNYTALMLKICREDKNKHRAHEKLTAYFSEKRGKDLKARIKRLVDGRHRSHGFFLIVTVVLVSVATLFLIGFTPQNTVSADSTTTSAPVTTTAPTVDGGEDLYPSTQDPDSITPAEKEGYTFSHWEKVIIESGEEMLKAIYTPNYYTVTFVTNGGTMTERPKTLPYASTLPAPQHEGYTFGGWFLDADLLYPVTAVPANDLTVYAFWLEESNTSRFTFEIHSNEATVTAFSGGGKVVLPAYYGGYPVTTVGKYAFSGSELEEIALPTTLRSVGTGAFYNCRSLETVVFHDSVSYIDRVAFDACYALKTVYYVGTPSSWQRIAGKDPSLPVTYLS